MPTATDCELALQSTHDQPSFLKHLLIDALHWPIPARKRLPTRGRPRTYAIKQVAPVIKEEATEIVVITVYTFYF